MSNVQGFNKYFGPYGVLGGHGGVLGEWSVQLNNDGSWVVRHVCRRKKNKTQSNKPAWTNKFHETYAKLLAQWEGKPRCIRCHREIPPGLILILQLKDV